MLANIRRWFGCLAREEMFETFYTFITTPLRRNSRQYTPGLVREYSFRFFSSYTTNVYCLRRTKVKAG